MRCHVKRCNIHSSLKDPQIPATQPKVRCHQSQFLRYEKREMPRKLIPFNKVRCHKNWFGWIKWDATKLLYLFESSRQPHAMVRCQQRCFVSSTLQVNNRFQRYSKCEMPRIIAFPKLQVEITHAKQNNDELNDCWVGINRIEINLRWIRSC